FFYYQKTENENINGQNQPTSNLEAQKIDSEQSSVVPANFKNLVNNTITNGRENIITNTVKNVSSAIVGVNVTETRYYRDPFSFFFE
ncbi:MAG: hypothetical protein KDC52_07675, partial [Ignavibacteriae bacterium]|nr:hypothetical protein [Ignavibacteriota bacterium]